MSLRRSRFILSMLVFGYVFLYVPILTLIVFSFNESKLVTVWSGFSIKWYKALLYNDQLLQSAWISLQVAFFSATLAVILGVLAAIILVRLGTFKGRTLFSGLTVAPLVMPEVITGLALLLLFVASEQLLGWPHGRGISTITIAHATLALSYVTVIIRSRLSEMDESVEEAALDLGARPATVFLKITLPIISPAIIAGWLLAFALSLDDLVLASFVSGPGSSTLPMVIFSSVRMGMNPQINALATLIILVVSLGVVMAGWLMSRREK